MVTESTVEWYRFTCPRCRAQWVAHYEVASFTDDAGQTRSFYRCRGLPCAAPARAGIACPICQHTPVHAELLGHAAADTVAEPPATQRPTEIATWRRGGAIAVARQYRFKAVISLDLAARMPVTQAAAETHSVMVHASRPDLPGSDRYFPAVIVRDDEQLLSPGDSRVVVTISVPDDEASEFFSAGRSFALWNGRDVGHGTVSRRVFFS
jgi:hypothetical protein